MSASEKNPISVSLSALINEAISNAFSTKGKCWPCTVKRVLTEAGGQTVEVSYDVQPNPGEIIPTTIMSVATFEYIRFPVQVGDRGFTLCADVSLREVTGRGTGTPRQVRAPNFNALVFFPVATLDYFDINEPRRIVLYGPDGGVLRTAEGQSCVEVDPTSATIETPDNINLKSKNINLDADVINLRGSQVINIIAPQVVVTAPTIKLNGAIGQDATQIPGSTNATFIGVVEAQDLKTGSVASVNNHEHDVQGVTPGGATITSDKPKG